MQIRYNLKIRNRNSCVTDPVLGEKSRFLVSGAVLALVLLNIFAWGKIPLKIMKPHNYSKPKSVDFTASRVDHKDPSAPRFWPSAAHGSEGKRDAALPGWEARSRRRACATSLAVSLLSRGLPRFPRPLLLGPGLQNQAVGAAEIHKQPSRPCSSLDDWSSCRGDSLSELSGPLPSRVGLLRAHSRVHLCVNRAQTLLSAYLFHLHPSFFPDEITLICVVPPQLYQADQAQGVGLR